MRLDKFTVKAQEAIEDAQGTAQRHNHSIIDVEHLLSALINQADGIITPLLSKLGVAPQALGAEMERLIKAKPKVYGDSAYPLAADLQTVHEGRGRGCQAQG